MSDKPDETEYYLRLVSMYMDLGTDIVLSVFVHHSPGKDAEQFLKSNHALLTKLNRKRTLNKEEYEKAIKEPPELKLFDISLMITLSINLFTNLPHPAKGWDHPPRNNDKSIGADLLRLRTIRNVIIGHHHAAQMPLHRFEEEWKNVSEILLRIQRQIAPEKEMRLKERIEAYRLKSLDISTKEKYDPKLSEWYEEVSKIQDQVEDLIKKLEGLDVYFKQKSDRYERYITLLVKGGRFVLSACLNMEIKKQQRGLRCLLDEQKDSLILKLTSSEQKDILYPSESDGSEKSLDVTSWEVPLLATVILHLFGSSIGSAVEEIQMIDHAYKTYVEKAFIALDSDKFEEYSSDLKANIKYVSKFLDEEQKVKCQKILEDCKQKVNEKDFQTILDELKTQGLQMKTLTDIHKETIQNTKECLQEMITKRIRFKNPRVLELKMIPVGNNEEQKKLAEKFLTEVWLEALERSNHCTSFPEVKKEVMKILENIKLSKSVNDVSVQTQCIILQIQCTVPSDALNLIMYFESDAFKETLRNISNELGYYFNTGFAINAVLPLDSLHELIQGMRKLRSLLMSERIVNSTNTIADALSRRLGGTITLNVCTDMKELAGVFDGDESSDSSGEGSSVESNAREEYSFNSSDIQLNMEGRTYEKMTEETNIKRPLTMSEVNKLLTDIESRVPNKSFNLLYCSIDKVDVDEFHEKCDMKGPTLTILYGKYNTFFGGYTSRDWSSGNKNTKRDEHAFLFYKKDYVEAECVFLPIKAKYVNRAITCDAKFGPTFGSEKNIFSKYDLQTFKEEKCNVDSDIKDAYIHLNGTMNIGHVYELEDKRKWKKNVNDEANTRVIYQRKRDDITAGINAGTLIVKRIEVYQVVADQLENPWRKKPTEDETDKMRKRLEDLEPVWGLDMKQYNILLVGVIGSGKSSFYNTLATVFTGSVKNHAPTRSSEASATNQVNSYELKSKAGKPLNIRIFDIRGFDVLRGYDHELELLLDGKLPVGYEFPDQPQPVMEINENASLKDKVHLVCFVSGTSNIDTFTDSLQNKINEIKDTVNKKGLPMVVVGTKFDEVCPKILEDSDRVYRSPKAYDAVKKIWSFFGVEEKHTFPVINYINDDNIKPGKDRLALQALDTMVRLTKDYLEKHKDKAKTPDGWSDRATRLHIPKQENDNEEVLKKLATDMSKLEEKQMNFLCVGAANSGKTSFINSVKATLLNTISLKASGGATGGIAEVSLTEKMYQLKYKHGPETIKPSNVFIGDTPGFQESGGVQLEDIKYIVKGKVQDKCKITGARAKTSKQFKKDSQKKETRIHCVCFVFDISASPEQLSNNVKETLQSLRAWLFRKAIPYVVILTKVDEVSESVKRCKLNVFENWTITRNKDKLIHMFQFKQNTMFPVINYIHDEHVGPESDALIIAAFRAMLTIGKEKLEDSEHEDSDDSDNSEA